MHLLKSNSIIKLSFFFSFIIRFAFTSLSSSKAKNWLSFKIIILLVYILIIPNRVPIVIIKKIGVKYKSSYQKLLFIMLAVSNLLINSCLCNSI
jgi:hypothetical protein